MSEQNEPPSNELTKQQVIDAMKGQTSTWLTRRNQIDNSEDDADKLVEASVMYQLLADMAIQHTGLVERIGEKI